MSTDAGKLNFRVTLQKESFSEDSFSSKTGETWTNVATVWANVIPLQGIELIRAQKLFAEVTYLVKIRYRENVTEDMRLLFRGKYLQIIGIINEEENDEFLILNCNELKGANG